MLTWGDIYAAGALQYLYQQNLRVPQDVEVVTCGDTLMPYLAPAISSVEVPLREMARTAVAIINDQLADGQKDFVKTWNRCLHAEGFEIRCGCAVLPLLLYHLCVCDTESPKCCENIPFLV